MKRFAFAICACVLAAVVSGCAETPAEDKYLSHWEKIVSLVSTNKNDAAKASAAVKDYLKNNLDEMKSLAAKFGDTAARKLVDDPGFIRRVIELIDNINTIQKENPGLFNGADLNAALTPLTDLMK